MAIVITASPAAIGLEKNMIGFKSDLISVVTKLNSTIGPKIIARTIDGMGIPSFSMK